MRGERGLTHATVARPSAIELPPASPTVEMRRGVPSFPWPDGIFFFAARPRSYEDAGGGFRSSAIRTLSQF